MKKIEIKPHKINNPTLLTVLAKWNTPEAIKKYSTTYGLDGNKISICANCHRKFNLTMFPPKLDSNKRKNHIDDYNIQCRFCEAYRKDSYESFRTYTNGLWTSQKIDDMEELRQEYYDAPVITLKGEIDPFDANLKWHSYLTRPIDKVKIEKPSEVVPIEDIMNKIVPELPDNVIDDSTDNFMKEIENKEIEELKAEIALLKSTIIRTTLLQRKVPEKVMTEEKEKEYIYPDCAPFKPKHPHSRPILKFELSGKYVRRYESVKEAADDNGCADSNLVRCAKGGSNTAVGHLWHYEDEYKALIQSKMNSK